tara:strand:+ start:610 stop:1023 length:414 start_codon:yes stop_codon:yes gene_type:complete
MNQKFRNLILIYLAFFIIIITSIFSLNTEIVSGLETENTSLIKKVSKDYTKKFCNSIAFGLSKESAMNFSIEENKKAFEKRKGFQNINKELLAEEISSLIIETCGYPINLSGEKGIKEFKNYYLSKDQELSNLSDKE